MKFTDSIYFSLAQSDYVRAREIPSSKERGGRTFPEELTLPQYSPLAESLHVDSLYYEPENTPHDPYTFRLSESERLALARALEQDRHRLFAGALASALFTGRGTLEVVGCASLLRRLASALSSLLQAAVQATSLRLEIEDRLEELFPNAPVLDVSLAQFQLFSCPSCGGDLHVRRRGQECTCVVIDHHTGRLVRGSAILTDDYFGKPSFYVYDSEVVCKECYKQHTFLEYDAYLGELIFTCVVCKVSRPLNTLQTVRPMGEHARAPVCMTCERATRS